MVLKLESYLLLIIITINVIKFLFKINIDKVCNFYLLKNIVIFDFTNYNIINNILV